MGRSERAGGGGGAFAERCVRVRGVFTAWTPLMRTGRWARASRLRVVGGGGVGGVAAGDYADFCLPSPR